MFGRTLAALGVFLDHAGLVDGQGHCLSDARIVQRFFRDVEPHEVTAEIIELVKVRSLAEGIEQLGRHEAFVPDDIGLAGFEQVDRCGR